MIRRVAIVGAGFSGAVLARELAEGGLEVHLLEQRQHLAGNCHTERDSETGILVHRYGPHIFHTRRPELWAYVQRFGRFRPFTNRVKAVTARGVFSLPINLLTLNQFFGRRLNPQQAQEFLAGLGDPGIGEPANFEEQALKMVGPELYAAFFRDYTKKQWGCDPKELPASILKRLPIRCSYDDNYYEDPYQGLPEQGYTALVEQILKHPHIHVELGTIAGPSLRDRYDWVFWTGPLDAWFGYRLGALRYRTLDFSWERGVGDLQGNPVLNYCEETVAYTRVTEHKHLSPWEQHPQSILCREYPRAKEPEDVPFYPLRLAPDLQLLASYQALAAREERVSFLGRLGSYRYLDMDQCIAEALDLSRDFLEKLQ